MAKKEIGFNPKVAIGLRKTPLRLTPAALIVGTSVVQTLGAHKYDPYNWRRHSVSHVAYLEAMLRHVLLALDGEDVDEESGETHELHAAACVGIIEDARALGRLVDDRYKTGRVKALLKAAEEKCAAIRKRFEEKERLAAKAERKKRR